MKVSTTKPFQIIYSLFEHEFLGHLFAAFVVQLSPKGQLTLQHQTLSGKNVHEFDGGLEAIDFELVELCDQMQQEAVIKEFWPRKVTTADFFLKIHHPGKGDKPLQEAMARHVQVRMAAVLARLGGRRIFIMGRDGEPTWHEIALAPQPASILFHFRRNDDGTHYFPTIQYQNQRLDFQYKDAALVCLQPAWLLLGDVLYSFRNEVDGRKILPFLKKKFIVVPRQVEESYFQKFVAPLMESFEVHARGFDIRSERYLARPWLTFTDAVPAPTIAEVPLRPLGPPRRGRVPLPKPVAAVSLTGEELIYFDLSFRYGPHAVPLGAEKPVSVRLEKTPDSYVFHRLLRNSAEEAAAVEALRGRGLAVAQGRATLPKSLAFAWLAANSTDLQELGYTIESAASAGQRYFVGAVRAEVGIVEAGDWFDVRGTVYFGDFAVPFVRLRGHILQRRREFRLPDGQIAIIPEAWFVDYLELFAFAEEHADGLGLRRHHLALVADLQSAELATVKMTRKLAKLRDFAEVEDQALPVGFTGELRPYQKAGYNWLRFVQDYQFGGCLADDMGLGKAQPLHARVLTPTGWKTMAEMAVGQEVINAAGTVSRVVGVFPQGEKEVFRVTFTDNSTAECCAEHLWAVQSPVQKYRNQPYRTKSLAELRDDLHDKHGNTKWFIPLVQPVQFAAQPVPLDPYFLGLLLGDGCFRNNRICLSSGDAEVVAYARQAVPAGMLLRHQPDTYDYLIVKNKPGSATNELMQCIERLGLKELKSHNKFIPEVYLLNDVTTRLGTLQGLLDSDGYVSADGVVCQYTSVSSKLVEGVTFLVQSLGGTVRASSKIPTYTYAGERRTGQLAYTLTLSLPPHLAPFRLARKAALYRPKTKYQPYRGIKSIELTGILPTQCIAVDAPDHLYVTDNFILTHNTIQTLAMLQQRHESGAAKGAASLLVLPTSLVYNWLNEARKFTPTMRVLAYTSSFRSKDVAQFAAYDLIITSYGIARLDTDLLAAYRFDYVILDESQAIKNPGSTTSQAVRQLRSKFRLILTGTPVENSTMDLWSQMSFINPGLLGTQAFFRKEFLKPIEKNQDESRTRRLHALIKPFILRRHKAQVAKELPAKSEQLVYCTMTEEQAQAYEEAKSYYRNKILHNLGEHGAANTQFVLLQGLTRLRQLANHPKLVDAAYAHESGKLREVLRMLRNVVTEGHKVLVFSQFVQHLALVRAALDERQLPYAYLDGATRDRAAEVARFQETEALQIFLISLKAGGLGLNLTAADYVFILDPWWNPAVEAQAVDRAHRIGQRRPVFVYKFLSRNTVEEKILALQQRKLALVGDLISTDETVVKHLTRADIEELLG